MARVEDYLFEYEGEQRRVLDFFHGLLSEDLNLMPKLRYNIPFYYGKSWICYLNTLKDGSVELAFTRGNELSNAQGILESKGRKQVMSLCVKRINDIPLESLQEVLQEALLLDQRKPYAAKRKAN